MKPLGPEQIARSKRVQSLMEMTGVSRREFGRATGVSHSTIQHWESTESHGLPERAAKRFLKALATYGVECSVSWLLYGVGEKPSRSERTSTLAVREERLVYPDDSEDILAIKAELEFFLNHHKNAIEYLVPNDAMQPRFVAGEIVAGIRHFDNEIEKLIDLDCIVLVEGGDMFLRTVRRGNLPGHYHLTHTNLNTAVAKPVIYDVKLVSAAPVIWARRRNHFF